MYCLFTADSNNHYHFMVGLRLTFKDHEVINHIEIFSFSARNRRNEVFFHPIFVSLGANRYKME